MLITNSHLKECSAEFPVACQANMRVLIAIALFGTVSASCRPGQSSEPGSNKCYFFVDNPLHYSASELLCQRYGGHLASITNALEQPLIVQAAQNGGMVTSENVWIGLRQGSNGQFVWEDGTPYSFNKFGQEVGNGECVMFQLATGAWRLENCAATHSSICVTNSDEPPTTHPVFPVYPEVTCPSPPPPSCDNGWKYFNGYCYKVLRNVKNGNGFETQCNLMSAHLASIHDDVENDFVYSIAMDGVMGDQVNQHQYQLFIGLQRNDQDYGFHNLDGTPVDFTKWADGNPSYDSGNKCVQMYTVQLVGNKPSGTYMKHWNDVECASDRAAVCKKQAMY